MAQIALDTALAELNNLQANSKLTKAEVEDDNVIVMLDMMNTIEVNQAESNVRRAQLQLENAQNHLMNAQEQKQILNLIQNLTQGDHCKLQNLIVFNGMNHDHITKEQGKGEIAFKTL